MSKSKSFDDILDSCPNCGAIWGSDEIGLGRCFACGYVEGDNPDYEDDDEIVPMLPEQVAAIEKEYFTTEPEDFGDLELEGFPEEEDDI